MTFHVRYFANVYLFIKYISMVWIDFFITRNTSYSFCSEFLFSFLCLVDYLASIAQACSSLLNIFSLLT